MTNLQIIRKVARDNNLEFIRTNSKINGACLYNFVDQSGFIVAQNWTIQSAINKYRFGDLKAKIS